MSYQIFSIKNLSISIENILLFSDFSASIYSNNKICIIGRNGSGKTTLLKSLAGNFSDYNGDIIKSKNISSVYIKQTLNIETKSCGEHLFQKLWESFRSVPNLILLDEPTNHLDEHNRNQLDNLIDKYQGCIIAVSHDEDFIQKHFDIILQIRYGHIEVFKGKYLNLIREDSLKISKLKKI